MIRINRLFVPVLLVLMVFLFAVGCTKSSSSNAASDTTSANNTNNTTNNSVSVSGSVSAPGGIVAMNQMTGWRRFLAWLSPSEAIALSPGMSSVGSGVTVKLIQIDNTGTQVGPVLAIATTDSSGNYVLQAPADFVPASNYVVSAVGTGVTIQSFATSTTVNVDPYTHATVKLITGSISSVSTATIVQVTTADVAAVLETVLNFSTSVSTTSLNVNTLVTNLQNIVSNSADASPIITSLSSTIGISGSVTDDANNPVPGILIMVETFNDRLIQAMVRTDSLGNYSVRVPAGDYVLGAVNDTSTSTVASTWWTSSGGTPGLWTAGKITVGSEQITRNFTLSEGGRISGTVLSADGSSPLQGIHVVLSDYVDGSTLMYVITKSDGSYNINVAPGDYYIFARNLTLLPYATQMYSSTLGSAALNKTQADKITTTEGSNITANMSLVSGVNLSGLVTDPVTGPVPGRNMRLTDANDVYAGAWRTNNDGTYQVWLQPGKYTIRTYGQITTFELSTSQSITFNAAVGEYTGYLQDTNGNPVGQAFIYAYNVLEKSPVIIGTMTYEASSGDGSFKIWTPLGNSSIFLFRNDDNLPDATFVYTNATNTIVPLISGATFTSTSSPTNLGTITMPAGAFLRGVVTDSNSNPRPGISIQVRVGGTSGAYHLSNVQTMSDGSYAMNLPAGATMARICAYLTNMSCPGVSSSSTGTYYNYSDNVTMGAVGTATTLNFQF
jgi:hypothetical protein